jgi:hypothetical protein
LGRTEFLTETIASEPIAGLAFWVGGRAISEFGGVDRVLAEGLGLSIAFATGLLGYILKTTADDLGVNEDSVNE